MRIVDPAAVPLSFVTTLEEWGLPSGILGALVLLALWIVVGGGALLAVMGVVRRRAARSQNHVDDAIVRSLRWPSVVVWVLVGAYLFTRLSGLFAPAWQTRIVIGLAMLGAIVLSHGVSRLIIAFIEHRARRRPSFRAMKGILEFGTRLAVYSLALLLVLDHLAVEITPLIGAFGIGALAVALALQDTLSNFFAGLYMTIDRPLREGDFIEVDGGAFGKIGGYVVEIGWRNVRIRELSNNIFVMPNSRLASGIIKNYDLPQSEMSVVQQCSVAYGSDLERVERVVVAVAKECHERVTGAVIEHEPFIRYHTFGDDGIKFSIILRVRTFVDQYLMVHEFVKALHAGFEKEGIEIPFPQRTLHFPEVASVAVQEGPSDGDGRGPQRVLSQR